MLSLIKSLFRQKEKIGLTLESLEDWFSQKTKNFYESQDRVKKEIIDNIKEEISIAKDNIEALESAELRNKNITTKELQFMDGNRSFYTKKVTSFIESLSMPDSDLQEFADQKISEINSLGESTLKSYQILQHFFGDESYKIAQNIKRIDRLLEDLKKSLSDKNIRKIEEINSDISSLKQLINKEKELKESIIKTEKNQRELEKEKKNILSEISHKEQSHECKEYHILKTDEYKLNEQLSELKSDVFHYFSVLEHSLKKHSRLDPADEQLINNYLEDALSALVKDYKLEIINVLKRAEQNITDGKIELKDKKKDKSLEIMQSITQSKLASFLTEYNHIMVDLNNLAKRVNLNKIMEDIEKIKESLSKKESEIESINKRVLDQKEELSKIDINKSKKEVKNKIEDLLDIDLEID